MPDPVPAEPRLVKVPLAEAKIGDYAIVLHDDGAKSKAVIDNVTPDGIAIGYWMFFKFDGRFVGDCGIKLDAVYSLTDEPDPRAADAEAMARLERHVKKNEPYRGVEIYPTSNDTILVAVRIWDGRLFTGKAPTLAAAIMSALAAAGAPQ